MFNLLKKTLTIIIFANFLFLVLVSETLAADTPDTLKKFEPQFTIPGGNGIDWDQKIRSGTAIGGYIRLIYNYAVSIVGVVAAVVLMFGGIMWITAGGNAERISSAKAWIGAALTGLVLLMSIYTILYLVNPNLTVFKPIKINPVGKKTQDANTNNSGCCVTQESGTIYFNCTDVKAGDICNGSFISKPCSQTYSCPKY